MKRWILVLALAGSVGCHAPVSVQTAQGKAAYTADQIVQRVAELQNAAIQANSVQALDEASTRKIVTFCVSAAQTLKATPSGWQATVGAAWAQLKPSLRGVTNPAVLAAIQAADVVLAAFGS